MNLLTAIFAMLIVPARSASALELSDVNPDSIKAVHFHADALPVAAAPSAAISRSFIRVDKCWTRSADGEADRLGLPAEFCLARLGLQTPSDNLDIFDHRTVILTEGPKGLRQVQITGYANYGGVSTIIGTIFSGGRAFAAIYLTASTDGKVLNKPPEIRGFIRGASGTARELPYSAGGPFAAASSEKSLRPDAADGSSELTGFLTRFEGRYHVGSNLYFDHAGKSRLVEDFTRVQTFSLRGRDLYISVKGYGEYRLGAIDLDPSELKERETRKFRLTQNVATSTFYHNWRVPKVAVNFSAEITGFGLFTEVTDRTQTAISVKTAEGPDFCLYENMPGRAKGVLYPGACSK